MEKQEKEMLEKRCELRIETMKAEIERAKNLVAANTNKGLSAESVKYSTWGNLGVCCIVFGGTLTFTAGDKKLRFKGSFGGVGFGGIDAEIYCQFAKTADELVEYCAEDKSKNKKKEKVTFHLVAGAAVGGGLEVTWFEGDTWFGTAVGPAVGFGAMNVFGEGEFYY